MKNTKKQFTTEAGKKFAANLAQARAEAKRLLANLDAMEKTFQATEGTDWSFAGSAAHVVSLAKDAADFVSYEVIDAQES